MTIYQLQQLKVFSSWLCHTAHMVAINIDLSTQNNPTMLAT